MGAAGVSEDALIRIGALKLLCQIQIPLWKKGAGDFFSWQGTPAREEIPLNPPLQRGR